MAKTKNKTAPASTPALPPAAADAHVAHVDRHRPGLGEQVGDLVTGSVATVRGVLPAQRIPVYLAGAALAVTGLLEAPALLGLGLAYEALRRWEPAGHRRPTPLFAGAHPADVPTGQIA